MEITPAHLLQQQQSENLPEGQRRGRPTTVEAKCSEGREDSGTAGGHSPRGGPGPVGEPQTPGISCLEADEGPPVRPQARGFRAPRPCLPLQLLGLLPAVKSDGQLAIVGPEHTSEEGSRLP